VVAFNIAEHWAEDASEDIAREIVRRFGLSGDQIPSSLEAFVERHLGVIVRSRRGWHEKEAAK
jgi:hypothetical protein